MTAIDESRTIDTTAVPYAMRDRLHVPRERYFDRAFFELEKEKLWGRTWQMACRLEEIPHPNDFVEYEICGWSVLLIRQRDMSVKAFHNACRHRATQLGKGSGRLPGGQLVCPFHGWRWNTDGTNSFVYGAKGFEPDCLRPEDLRLRDCRVEVWGGCAWINLDPHAGPLSEALSPAAQLLEDVGVGNWQVKWWKEIILDANWKLAQEAFMEGYHVMQTHPQYTGGRGPDYPPNNSDYFIHAGGHSNFEQGRPPYPNLDSLLGSARITLDGQDAMILDRDMRILEGLRYTIRPDDDIAGVAATTLQTYAAHAGIPWTDGMENSPLFFGGEVFLFPNMFFLPTYGNALSYRIRPFDDDPERCRFEVWSLSSYPADEVRPRAELLGRFAADDTENWGLIPRQDFGNIARQQQGLHSIGFEELRLATEWEASISNMHVELDHRLAQA